MFVHSFIGKDVTETADKNKMFLFLSVVSGLSYRGRYENSNAEVLF